MLSQPKVYSAKTIILLCIGSSLLSCLFIVGGVTLLNKRKPQPCHNYIGSCLKLSPNQIGTLKLRDMEFKAKLRSMYKECNSLRQDLFDHIQTTDEFTPAIESLLLELNDCNSTIRYQAIKEYFMVVQTLPPEKRLAFIQLTQDYIYNGRYQPNN